MTSVPSLIDTALDRSVVLGYTRPGLAIRRALPGWDDLPRMDGRVALVTGTTSGIGLASAEAFAALGARVLMVVRDHERGVRARERLVERTGNDDVVLYEHDISTIRGMTALTGEVLRNEERLDVLVNNAGTMPGERTETEDGAELTFATHVLAPWVLTRDLSLLMRETPPGRIVNVSSGGAYSQQLAADDLQLERSSYSPKKAYARTKRAELVMTEQWAERLDGQGVVVHSMHPGWADTRGVRQWMPVFRVVTRTIIRSPAQGADTVVWLGAAHEPTRSTGRFWHDRRPRPTHYLPVTRESEDDRARLWAACEELVSSAAPALPGSRVCSPG